MSIYYICCFGSNLRLFAIIVLWVISQWHKEKKRWKPSISARSLSDRKGNGGKHSVKSHVNIWKMRARIKNTKAVVGEYSQYKVEAERRKKRATEQTEQSISSPWHSPVTPCQRALPLPSEPSHGCSSLYHPIFFVKPPYPYLLFIRLLTIISKIKTCQS